MRRVIAPLPALDSAVTYNKDVARKTYPLFSGPRTEYQVPPSLHSASCPKVEVQVCPVSTYPLWIQDKSREALRPLKPKQ